MKVYNKHKDKTVPAGAVYVGRPTKWGNPFTVESFGREECLRLYRIWLDKMIEQGKLNLAELRGKDLVCWCSPEPCHADILMERANKE